MIEVEPARALGWRLERLALEPASAGSVAEVVRAVLAVRGWPAAPAELAVRTRQRDGDLGGVARAIADGDVLRSYAFRGGSYVLAHHVAAVLLTVRTTSEVWASRRYQQQGGFALDDWTPVREAIADVLADGPATRAEIGSALARSPSLAHLEHGATGAGADSLYKPLHWWGDIAFGPQRDDGSATFRLLGDDERWSPLDVDEAGREAVLRTLGAYGPSTMANLEYWLVEGLSVPRRRLRTWIAELGDAVTEVSLGGASALLRTDDVDAVRSASPASGVQLLPPFDPWINGPGTADARVVPQPRRALVSRGASLVVHDGVVHGTWRERDRSVTLSWFPEGGPPPRPAIERAVQRLARIRGHELDCDVEAA